MAAAKIKKAASSSRACANCGALENPPDTTLSACARCHVVFYCSRTCQVQHWKQKPAGHKQFCFTCHARGAACGGRTVRGRYTHIHIWDEELYPRSEPTSTPFERQ